MMGAPQLLRSASGRALTVLLGVLAGAVAIGTVRNRASAQPAAAQPATPTGSRTGQQIYEKHCIECHGRSGKGDGPAAHLMTPRPRDFSTARYKIRSTETGSLPADADLQRSVRQGLYGTA